MRPFAILLAVCGLLGAQTPRPGKNSFTLRGQRQDLYYYPGAGNRGSDPVTILFAPGDGGWRGAAVTIAETMASWGHEVYGFDTKRYLESFTGNRATLTEGTIASDLREAVQWITRGSGSRVVFVGWSQGAGMALLAASAEDAKSLFSGVVTLGLPVSAVLGWRFADMLAVLARREPNEPSFGTMPLLPSVAPLPVFMIYASGDEYTGPEEQKRLFAAAREPKRLALIEGSNHRFDGRRDELFKWLKEGLDWIARSS